MDSKAIPTRKHHEVVRGGGRELYWLRGNLMVRVLPFLPPMME